MKGQLAMTQPTRKVSARGLTRRQRAAWRWARSAGHPFTPDEFARYVGYKDPHHALHRLIRRGMVMRVVRGYYTGVTPGERVR